MKRIERLLTQYGEIHQNKWSRSIHLVAIPVLIFSFLALLWVIPSSNLRFALGTGPFNNWASISLFLLVIYYLRYSIPVGLGVGVLGVLSLHLIHLIDQELGSPLVQIAPVVLVLALVAWYQGCIMSDRKISLRDCVRLLPGSPVWWMTTLFRSMAS